MLISKSKLGELKLNPNQKRVDRREEMRVKYAGRRKEMKKLKIEICKQLLRDYLGLNLNQVQAVKKAA